MMSNKTKLNNEQNILRVQSEGMAQSINEDVHNLIGLLVSVENNKRDSGKPSYFKITDKDGVSLNIQLTNSEYKNIVQSKLETLKENILNNIDGLKESINGLDFHKDDKK